MALWQLWLIVALAFAVLEIRTTAFFSLWFGIGALAAAIAGYFHAGVEIQLLLFAAVSLVLVLSTRRIAKRWNNSDQSIVTGVERVIGQDGRVIRAISGTDVGQVKVEGEIWTSVSATGEPIARGASVRVLAVRGVRLVVEAKQEEEQA
jgi:membrane protein implicated in regulation of membrane protease activity